MALVFSIPKGYTPPDGTKEGQEFSEIGYFKFEGKEMMLVAIGREKTPVLSRDGKKEEDKPKGAKAAMKEQLESLQDKSGSEQIEDTEQETQEQE